MAIYFFKFIFRLPPYFNQITLVNILDKWQQSTSVQVLPFPLCFTTLGRRGL